MNKYVIAVSGGVDSVVLLDMLANQSDLDLIVAHFDHGIRSDSAEDAKFVEALAKKYGLKFECRREELGVNAGEEFARQRRYKFLRSVASKYKARLVTAHHEDDVVETIAINITRGTGWRGLAVLDSDIFRPLLSMYKSEIMEYAKRHKLDWRDDNTNVLDIYLRNRIRKQTMKLNDDTKRQLLALWSDQKRIKRLIDQEVSSLAGDGPTYSRYFFSHIDEKTALEFIRYITQARLTRPQSEKMLRAIKTFLPGKNLEAGNGVNIRFTSRNFTVELLK